MPLDESDHSTRAMPRWLLAVTAISALACAWLTHWESRHPPVRDTRIAWVSVRQASTSSKPVLFVFSAAWCQPCKALEQELENESVAELINRTMTPVHLVDRTHEDGANAPDVAELVERYEVKSFPTLVKVTLGGAKPRTFIGYQDANALQRLLEQ